MSQNIICGIKTPHRNGAIYKREVTPGYLMMCFRTDFFYVADGKRIEGKAGDCLVHRPGANVMHGPINEKESFVNDWIFFKTDNFEFKNYPFDKILPSGDENFFASGIGAVIKETERGDEYSRQIISNAIYKMLVFALRISESRQNAEGAVFERLNSTRNHIFNRYSEKWTLERMAALSGYSVSRFCSLYNDCFGKSPVNDLLEKRIEISRKFLEYDLYKIEDIADLCGFSSVHYFSKFFKKRVGVSPTEYRNINSAK